MNPIFIIGLFIVALLIWLLCAFLYKPIGKLFSRIFKDAIDEMTDDKENNKDKMEE